VVELAPRCMPAASSRASSSRVPWRWRHATRRQPHRGLCRRGSHTGGEVGNGLRADSSSACTSSSFAVVQDEGERHRLTCMLHGEEEKERERLTISAMILTVGKR
jgi:hypothetical protein